MRALAVRQLTLSRLSASPSALHGNGEYAGRLVDLADVMVRFAPILVAETASYAKVLMQGMLAHVLRGYFAGTVDRVAQRLRRKAQDVLKAEHKMIDLIRLGQRTSLTENRIIEDPDHRERIALENEAVSRESHSNVMEDVDEWQTRSEVYPIGAWSSE